MSILNKIIQKIKLELYRFSSTDSKIIYKVIKQKLTYLNIKPLEDIKNQVLRIERENVQGDVIENGVALGGSAAVLAYYISSNRKCKLYDTFGMIPPPDENDNTDSIERYKEIVSGNSDGIGGDPYSGYQGDLLIKVKKTLKNNLTKDKFDKIEFHKGLYENTLNLSDPVALAHIDCDWYSSVITCLQNIIPVLSIGGTLIIDDYKYYEGCKKAVDDFFKDRDGFNFEIKERLHITRTK